MAQELREGHEAFDHVRTLVLREEHCPIDKRSTKRPNTALQTDERHRRFKLASGKATAPLAAEGQNR
jgi:hypothetical protein